MTNTTGQHSEFELFLRELKAGDAFAKPTETLSWQQTVAHLSREGRPIEIDADTWWEYLDLLPPRWMSVTGHAFVFAEDGNCFHLFWRTRERYFARLLTEAETDRFCRLSGARRWQ
ncbi:MAG: hypothetical protein MPJ50_11930 [Pirellulales bacterium]|nr:hypothetical protein [Pirellulales bacterium]